MSFMVWLWLLGSRCETSAREPGAVGSSDLSLGPKALIDAPPCRRPEKTRTRQELAEPFPRASSGRWRFLPLHKPERNVKMPGSNCSAEFEPARYRHRTQAFHFGAPHAPRSRCKWIARSGCCADTPDLHTKKAHRSSRR